MAMGGRIGGQRGYQQPPMGGGGYPAGPGKGRASFGQPPMQQQPPYDGGYPAPAPSPAPLDQARLAPLPVLGGPTRRGTNRLLEGAPPGPLQQPQGSEGFDPSQPLKPETGPPRFSQPPRPEYGRGSQLGSYGSPSKGMRPQSYGGGFGGRFGGYQPSPYQIGSGVPGRGQKRSPFPQFQPPSYGGGFGGYQPPPYGGGFGGYQPSPFGGGFGGGFGGRFGGYQPSPYGGGFGGYQQSPYGGGFSPRGMPMGIGSLLRPNMQGLERQRTQAMMGINPYMR
jgi:hypothetical protein